MILRAAMFGAVSTALSATPTTGAEDAGAKLYKNHCGVCHSLDPAAPPRQGPHLHGLFQREAGTLEGYKYSAALKAAAWQWTPEQLDRWLTDPKALVPGTTMSVYRQKDPDKRKLIIDYLIQQ
jgi:cytochrome c